MRYTDEQTERAIEILTAVIAASGTPLPAPSEVRAMETEGRDTEVMTAKMRMLYPTVPAETETSERARLWRRILDGQYEGIEVVRTMDYEKAWTDTDGGSHRPKLGTSFERWYSARLRNALAALIVQD